MIPESYVHGFIGALVAGAAGLLLTAIITWIRKRVKIAGPAMQIIADQARQLIIQQRLVMMLVDLTKPQLLALLSILEALQDKMNGNFERPHAAIRSSLDVFDETMLRIVSGECAEKEKKEP